MRFERSAKSSQKSKHIVTHNKAIWMMFDLMPNKGKYNEKYKKLFYFQFYSSWISIKQIHRRKSNFIKKNK